MKTIPELMRDVGYFTFNSGKDDYNFHYDRRKLYSVGTRDNYTPGMNGWQGNFAKHSGSFTEDTWRARPDKDQPWFGQIMIWGGKAGNKHVRKGEKLADKDVPIPPYFPDTPATTLAMGGAKMPDYLDGHDLFGPDFKERDFVISARDRCDYTIDRIRTVRSDKFRYIRNYFPERTMLQPQYRDHAPTVKDLKRLHAQGKLTDYQDKFWFGVRPKEELYDLAKDPYQIHNLADDPAFAEELEKHRGILADWITETGDMGQQAEDPVQLKATFDLWKNKPIFRDAKVNPADPGSWAPGDPLVPGDDTLKTHTDPAVETAAFFRVGVDLP